MSQRSFFVRAVWDEDNHLWRSESDIIGLHIEARNLEEFDDLVREFASELIVTNHVPASDFTSKPLREMIPAVVISHDTGPASAA